LSLDISLFSHFCHLFSLQLTLKECKKKKKSVQAASADGDDSIELTEDEIAHVVEIYDFPTEFKSDDLLKLFQCYQYV